MPKPLVDLRSFSYNFAASKGGIRKASRALSGVEQSADIETSTMPKKHYHADPYKTGVAYVQVVLGVEICTV